MNHVTVQWQTLEEHSYLRFSFIGELTVQEALKAVDHWRVESDKSENRIDLIWNCLEMTGFEGEARKIWQKTMSEQKNKTGNIWLVVTNPLIRVSARTIALLTGYNLKTVTREADIK